MGKSHRMRSCGALPRLALMAAAFAVFTALPAAGLESGLHLDAGDEAADDVLLALDVGQPRLPTVSDWATPTRTVLRDAAPTTKSLAAKASTKSQKSTKKASTKKHIQKRNKGGKKDAGCEVCSKKFRRFLRPKSPTKSRNPVKRMMAKMMRKELKKAAGTTGKQVMTKKAKASPRRAA